jgi:hypothetical protein
VFGIGYSAAQEQKTLWPLQDFHDLVGILEQHPEWRAELRRLVLTEELLEDYAQSR